MVTGSLYNYFSTVLKLRELHAERAARNDIMKELGLRFDFFLADYEQTARNFSTPALHRVFALLREYDLKSKGVGSNLAGRGEAELLRELAWKILHPDVRPQPLPTA